MSGHELIAGVLGMFIGFLLAIGIFAGVENTALDTWLKGLAEIDLKKRREQAKVWEDLPK